MTGRPSPAESRRTNLEAFRQFWAAYPKKIAPTEAEKVFRETVDRGVDPDYLIAKAKAYGLTVDPNDLRYVPSPHSWLRQGRYDDADLFTSKRESELEWMRDCYRRVDVKAVENRFGVAFPKSYPPDDVTDPAAIKMWFKATARAWISKIASEKLGAVEGSK